MRRGGPKVELATRRRQVNGLPPKSAPDAIKFRPVQPPQPQMCPVERAKNCDFRSIINGLLLFKEGSWVYSSRTRRNYSSLVSRGCFYKSKAYIIGYTEAGRSRLDKVQQRLLHKPILERWNANDAKFVRVFFGTATHRSREQV